MESLQRDMLTLAADGSVVVSEIAEDAIPATLVHSIARSYKSDTTVVGGTHIFNI